MSRPFHGCKVERICQTSSWLSAYIGWSFFCKPASRHDGASDPAFAFFSSKAFDPEYQVPDDFVYDVGQLIAEYTPMYGDKLIRGERIRRIFSMATQNVLGSTLNSDKIFPDFVVQSQHKGSYLVVASEKNGFDNGVSDPSVQASLAYLRLIHQPEVTHL